ncbi:hypothetical protein YC2023_011027 [Brassica napus]
MVGSENTNAAENDRINRNLLILRQTTEKEKKGSMFSNAPHPCIVRGTLVGRLSLIGHDSKHGLAARMKLNDQSIGCFHLWASSTALTPYVISRQPTYMKRRIGFSGIPRSKAAQRIGNEAQSGLRGWARLLSPYIGRGGSQVARSKITISALVVISGLKESTKANKVDSLLSQLATGIAADPVVFLFYGLSAGRVKVESRSSPTGERQGMILLRYELAEGMKRSQACFTNGRSQLRSSSFAEEARFLLDVVGSNPISALSKGFILHHSPRRSRPCKVFEAAEAGKENTAFLQHILDDLSEIGVQSSAFKDAMNQIGLEAQSLLDQFEIVPLIPINIGNFYFSFTNPSLFMLLTLSFFLLLIHYITKKGGGNLVPNAWQSLVELLYDFVLNLFRAEAFLGIVVELPREILYKSLTGKPSGKPNQTEKGIGFDSWRESVKNETSDDWFLGYAQSYFAGDWKVWALATNQLRKSPDLNPCCRMRGYSLDECNAKPVLKKGKEPVN